MPAPRPVGVAGRCELLIIELNKEQDGPLQTNFAERLEEQLPDGMKLLKVEPLPDKCKVRVKAAAYELALTDAESARVRKRLSSLKRAGKWEVSRRRGGKEAETDDIVDIKAQVGSIDLSPDENGAERLRFTITTVPPAGLIGPERVLRLLGLAEVNEALAGLIKTDLECEFDAPDTELRNAAV